MRVAAWIVAIAGVSAPLERAVQRALAPRIDAVGKGVCQLIAIKASLRLGPAARKVGGRRGAARAHWLRTVIGSRLRRLVRARDLRARIAAILMLLQNAEQEAARFAKRLRCGLMRRRGGVPKSAFVSAPIAGGYATPGFAADTS
jgi:hypothetical protein